MIRAPARASASTSMVLAMGAMLVASLALQLVAYGRGGHESISDLPHLYLGRHVGPGALPYLDRRFEYPVLAGVLLFLASVVWSSPLGVLVVTALSAAALCVVVTVLLARRFGATAWRWALAVPVVLYAFQNWDVFAIAALVVGLLAFERHHDLASGAAFGLGAAVKLFPAAAVPSLAALRWTSGDRRGAVRLAATAVGVLLLVNLPVALANPSGWWWPFSFQSGRQATWGSAWFYVLRFAELPVRGTTGAQVANTVSLLALVFGLTWCVMVTARRRPDPFAAAAMAVAVFVLCNKVYSPTYDVWLVAFFVMVPLGRRLWVTFCAVDLAVFATVFGYFAGMDSVTFVRTVLPVLVAVRTGVLLTVVTRSARLGEPRVASRGPARVAER